MRDAISAAVAVNALVQSGLRKLEIPPSITEEKFVAKLKQGQGFIRNLCSLCFPHYPELMHAMVI